MDSSALNEDGWDYYYEPEDEEDGYEYYSEPEPSTLAKIGMNAAPVVGAAGKLFAGLQGQAPGFNLSSDVQNTLLDAGKDILQGLGTAKRGAYHGLTFGASQYIPGIELSPEEENTLAAGIGKFAGSAVPIHGVYSAFSKPLLYMASKSPVLASQLGALGKIFASGLTGATVQGAESSIAGKGLDVEDMLKHGFQWSLLDAALSATGYVGRFAKSLFSKASKADAGASEILSLLFEKEAVQAASKESPEAFSKSVMDTLKNLTKEDVSKGLEKVRANKATPLEFERPKPPEFQEPVKPERPRAPLEAPQLEEAIKASEAAEIPRPSKEAPPAKSEKAQYAEGLAERPTTRRELGETIKRETNETFKREEEYYNHLYKRPEEVAKTIEHSPEAAINYAKEVLAELESLKTRPEGYDKVIKNIKTALSDMGFEEIVIPAIEGPAAASLRAAGINPASRTINASKPVKLSQSMELARRINKVVNYDIVEKNIKDKLKPLAKKVKQDNFKALKAKDPQAADQFLEAEREFGRVAEEFGAEPIYRVRKTFAGEDIAKLIDKPTALERIKKIVSPETAAAIDREIVETLSSMSAEARAKAARELSPFLSEEAKRALKIREHAEKAHEKAISRQKEREVLAREKYLKDKQAQRRQQKKELAEKQEAARLKKHEEALKKYQERVESEKEYQRAKAKYKAEKERIAKAREAAKRSPEEEGLLADLQKAAKTGTVPEKALTYWQTPKGRQFIKDTLKDHPDLKKVLTHLEEQTFDKLAKSVIADNNTIDFKKLRSLMSDPVFRSQMEELGGKRALTFFSSLEKIANGIEKNISRFDKIEDKIKELGLGSKAVLSALSAITFGPLPTAGAAVGVALLRKMAKSPKLQKAFVDASSRSIDAKKFLSLMKVAMDELNKPSPE